MAGISDKAFSVAIVGGGFGGVGAAIRLLQEGRYRHFSCCLPSIDGKVISPITLGVKKCGETKRIRTAAMCHAKTDRLHRDMRGRSKTSQIRTLINRSSKVT